MNMFGLIPESQDDAGREARFTALVKRQSRFVLQVAYSVLRNMHDAEEVVQETFLKLYRTGAWETIVQAPPRRLRATSCPRAR